MTLARNEPQPGGSTRLDLSDTHPQLEMHARRPLFLHALLLLLPYPPPPPALAGALPPPQTSARPPSTWLLRVLVGRQRSLLFPRRRCRSRRLVTSTTASRPRPIAPLHSPLQPRTPLPTRPTHSTPPTPLHPLHPTHSTSPFHPARVSFNSVFNPKKKHAAVVPD